MLVVNTTGANPGCIFAFRVCFGWIQASWLLPLLLLIIKPNHSGSDSEPISASLCRAFPEAAPWNNFHISKPQKKTARTSCKMLNYSLLASSALVKGNVKSCLSSVGRCAWQGDCKKICQKTGHLVWMLLTGSEGASRVRWLLFLVYWGGFVAESELILIYNSYRVFKETFLLSIMRKPVSICWGDIYHVFLNTHSLIT